MTGLALLALYIAETTSQWGSNFSLDWISKPLSTLAKACRSARARLLRRRPAGSL